VGTEQALREWEFLKDFSREDRGGEVNRESLRAAE
jgi:hypothetical protein